LPDLAANGVVFQEHDLQIVPDYSKKMMDVAMSILERKVEILPR